MPDGRTGTADRIHERRESETGPQRGTVPATRRIGPVRIARPRNRELQVAENRRR